MPGNTLTLSPNSSPLTLVSLGERVVVSIQPHLLDIVIVDDSNGSMAICLLVFYDKGVYASTA